MELKNVKVWETTKENLKLLKHVLRLKSEAEVISYLMLLYNDNWQNLSVLKDIEYRRQVEFEKSGFDTDLFKKLKEIDIND